MLPGTIFLMCKAIELGYFIPLVCFNKPNDGGEQYPSFLGYEAGSVFVLFSAHHTTHPFFL